MSKLLRLAVPALDQANGQAAEAENPEVAPADPRGMTPRGLAQMLRVSPDKIRSWIASGELVAVNLATRVCGRPRFVVLPEALTAFLQRRQAGPPPKSQKRKKRTHLIDYYP